MFKALKLALVGIAALGAVALGGCNATTSALPTLNISNSVSLNTEAGILAGYGILVQAELAYKALPLCQTGTTPSLTNVCAKRSVIVRLQNADKVTNTAINNMVLFIKNNPNISPTGYISAARDAITAAQAILNSARS